MSADPRPSSLQRRSAARTAVVWDALREVLDGQHLAGQHPEGQHDGAVCVVDIGGGTGGFAVRVAELGHRVLVVDPSPDALATLARRADESGVADLVTGRQGDLDSLGDLVPEPGPDGGPGADVVLCHGVLDIVEEPVPALRALARVLRPGGTLSLLVNQRHAAVVARAMAGHFQAARALLDHTVPPAPVAAAVPAPEEQGAGPRPEPGASASRRFTADEVARALDEAGFDLATMQAVRVFVDLVPSSLVDLEPGAAQALVDLERAVATRPEYLPLGTQIHALATRR
ncbi:MAG TPA: methyltransferase [Nocardioidaceae bacterium]|nr:methyltransferase [Nocardioidaceae bacterium]